MLCAQQLGKSINNYQAACNSLQIPRASFYRFLKPEQSNRNKQAPPLALIGSEEQAVLDHLHSKRFVDKAPSEVYASLLDEGIYLCSIRTMYRILNKHGETKERRKHVCRSHYKKPELLATCSNQLWSWDITKLKGPQKWTYFYLYTIIDVFSRYAVGWMLAYRENSNLASQLINSTCEKHNIIKDQLTIHADRGASMKSKAVAFLLSDLGVTKTHSRPYTSNDNPYSESQFKTLKYCPTFPEKFGSIQDARVFCRSFFSWYNDEHKHSGLNLLTPAQVHYGHAEKVIASRNQVLNQAYINNPNRFKYKQPQHPVLPLEVWINKPKTIVHK